MAAKFPRSRNSIWHPQAVAAYVAVESNLDADRWVRCVADQLAFYRGRPGRNEIHARRVAVQLAFYRGRPGRNEIHARRVAVQLAFYPGRPVETAFTARLSSSEFWLGEVESTGAVEENS